MEGFEIARSDNVASPSGPSHNEKELLSSEKLQTEQSEATNLDSNSPISYLYLTFETNLPSPPILQQPSLDGREPPPCPDLAAYTDPLTWGATHKSIVLFLSCLSTFLTAYTAGAYAPPANIMAKDFETSRLVVLVGITTFCMGFAFAPMALAPLSEIWGRYPIFIISGTVFVIFQAVCSVMPDAAGMIVTRFLVGIGGSVFSAVVGGVLADLWEKEERNTPMALFSGAVLAGTGAGPLVSAALIETVGSNSRAWKWSFWVQVILDVGLLLSLVFFFRESRASVLLSKKAKKLNKWYDELEKHGVYGLWVNSELAVVTSAASSQTTITSNTNERNTTTVPCLRRVRWIVKADEQRASLGQIVLTSVQRPFHLLFTEPVVFCFSLWAAFSWGVLYLSFSVVPFLYGENFNMSSRVYVAMMIASAVATVVGIYQEHLLKHSQWKKQEEGFQYSNSRFWAFMRRRFPAEAPEARLYFTCITALLLPVGLFVAFLGSQGTEGYLKAVGLGLATWGIYSVYLASFNYLADTYHVYASSALAAQSFCRNVLGGCFPLITAIMFTNLGLKGAGGMLGGIATGLTIMPWVLLFNGEKIRARSKFAITLTK
ncbi:major facilitator superfamily domain, general substrate transporter [Trichoderma arundinaceum]|uniref:Major facilitator superfamily domain, general substrate transporter n=1 Tax=Trichoderma arundinaceum TaxID=490622 RepID=A0A395NTN6_TRIAR|nr:major facilitator superfamily domain, general substrate transporter [Trichoderma arundinaceum]